MNIAMIGIRGIPVIYSGFETVAEKLGVELVKRKHGVTVYCRKPYVNPCLKTHQGVRLVVLPVFRSKNWETFFHSLLATFHACCIAKPDLIYYFGVGSSLFSGIPHLFGIKTVVNVDGLDWKREKWGFAGRLFLHMSEYLASILPTAVMTDALYIQNYYKTKFRKRAHYIPYGFFEWKGKSPALKKYELEKNNYFVWVGRLVPDNHTEDMIHAFKNLKTEMKCVIMGDDLYQSGYKKYVYRLASSDKRIIFTGFLARNEYACVVKNSGAYIETKRSYGMHPSLVEAMGFGCFVISCDNDTHKAILGGCALFYKSHTKSRGLKEKMRAFLRMQKKEQVLFRKKIRQQAMRQFSWKHIVVQYEELFLKLIQSS